MRITPSVAMITTTIGTQPNRSSRATMRHEAARSSIGSAGPSAGLMWQRTSV
jgi:hypothetical protein